MNVVVQFQLLVLFETSILLMVMKIVLQENKKKPKLLKIKKFGSPNSITLASTKVLIRSSVSINEEQMDFPFFHTKKLLIKKLQKIISLQ